MASIVTKYQHLIELILAGADLMVPAVFTSIFTRQKPKIDLGATKATIEMFKGNYKVAAQVSMYTSGDDLSTHTIRPGESGANDYIYSLLQQPLELPAGVLNERVPGEPMFLQNGSDDNVKQFRLQYWQNIMSVDATRRLIRKNDLLAKQSYFDSEMDIKDKVAGVAKLIFPRAATLKNRTVTAAWSDAANAKPWIDYGNALREMKKQAQVNGINVAISMLSSDALNNLRAIYVSQKSSEAGDFHQLNNSYNLNPDNVDFPTGYQFLIDNGMSYGGWIRETVSNAKIYLFILPEMVDLNIGDDTENIVDYISGETITLSLDNPAYFKAYFGPGKKMPPSANVYNRILPALGADVIPPNT
ncbi:hypothetical protein KAR91_73650, partial [Candidatus Pacearchaeota archaeon]|nr:hypothetical protein [Candidatus Pacearchaeota archaeon]